jgi:hypothetical protein
MNLPFHKQQDFIYQMNDCQLIKNDRFTELLNRYRMLSTLNKDQIESVDFLQNGSVQQIIS